MNILVVNWQDWENPQAGGAEVYLYEIFSRLIKRGHSVRLLVSRAKKQRHYEILDGFKIYRVGKRSNFNFFVPSALRAILRHNQIDVIVDDLNKIPFYSCLVTRKKVVPMLMHLFRKAIYRETNTIFASYVFFAESIIPWFYAHADFVSISESTADDLRALGTNSRIHIVHCGIPPKPVVKKVDREKTLIAYVGRVKKYKSIDHFIKAVANIKKKMDIKAIVVGDGDAKDDLIKLSRHLGIEVDFTGFVSEEKKYEIYSKARVVVQPSIKEGWGLTAIEAQSCGTPVVCADSPGLREVVLDKKGGFLYDYGNIEQLTKNILTLLHDDDLWYSFSREAKKWASTFSWDNAADKMLAVLEHSLEKG